MVFGDVSHSRFDLLLIFPVHDPTSPFLIHRKVTLVGTPRREPLHEVEELSPRQLTREEVEDVHVPKSVEVVFYGLAEPLDQFNESSEPPGSSLAASGASSTSEK